MRQTARFSELVLLQDLEEVFDFEHSIFWHVCAVNGVPHSVVTEFRPKQLNHKLGDLIKLT